MTFDDPTDKAAMYDRAYTRWCNAQEYVRGESWLTQGLRAIETLKEAARHDPIVHVQQCQTLADVERCPDCADYEAARGGQNIPSRDSSSTDSAPESDMGSVGREG